MITGINFPDGRVVSLADLRSGNVPSPPAPLPYLADLASERQDDGPFHVTDLLIGTRESYLRRTKDYTVDFDDGAFSLLGRAVHSVLEHSKVATEIPWNIGWIQGKADLIEYQDGELTLVDYKVQGAYAVAKFIGMDYKEVPVLNNDRTEILYKSGKNAGKPRTRKEWFRNPEKRNQGTIQLQMNMYRLALNLILSGQVEPDPTTKVLLEPFMNDKITQMKVFFIVRDASTRQATSQGVDKRTYFEDVDFMSEADVLDFYGKKEARLLTALEKEKVPELCSDEENWSGRKCQGYCPVAEHCAAVGDNPHLTSENPQDSDEIVF